MEGDSASCAELYALLSTWSDLPLQHGIAVTGALNQHGDVLPVGGINETIEGWFRVCEAQGLTGEQGVLIPEHNRRHLMQATAVLNAVEHDLFHIYMAVRGSDGLALMTGQPSGLPCDDQRSSYLADSVLARSELNQLTYRRACRLAMQGRPPRRGRR